MNGSKTTGICSQKHNANIMGATQLENLGIKMTGALIVVNLVISIEIVRLVDSEDKIEGIKNYSIAVKEKGEDIIFLRKIVRGGTDESYGIHVARLAGVPKVVTQKADEILRSLERKNILTGQKQEKQDKKQVEGQFDLYNYKLAEIAHEVDKINLNELTPIDALNTLVRMKEKMK